MRELRLTENDLEPHHGGPIDPASLTRPRESKEPLATPIGAYGTIIQAGRNRKEYWRDLWKYRDLLYFIAWRDIAVKYKQTFMGFAWHFLRPLLTITVFTLVFGHLAKLPSNGVPYPLMVFAALLPWQFFSSILSECSGTIVNNSGIIAKLYFPRLLLPLSTVLVAFADLGIALLILIGTMFVFHYHPTIRLLALPIFIGLALVAALGFGVWFAALLVRFRDFRYIVTYGIQLGMYVSPIGFSSAIVPEKWRWLYALNPLVSVIDGFRWSILSSRVSLYWPESLASACLVSAVLVAGIGYFRHAERTFVDYL